jgi:antitoxin component HigA of HigAB toxin-antitoxin module
MMVIDQVKTSSRSSSAYESLVKRFPPRVIRSRESYLKTLCHIKSFKGRSQKLTADELDYLSLLHLLVKRYEGPEEKPRAVEYLKKLLDEHKLRIKDLSKILGKSPPLCSMILNGQRAITRQHAMRLGKYFGRGPDLFLM